MKIRNILTAPVVVAGILAALTVGIASAKSYKFILPASSIVGGYELKADQRYSLALNGSQAVIKGERYGKAVSVPVLAEQSPTKYAATSVESADGASPAGPRIIKAIGLGGTTTRLVFGQ